MDDGQARRRFGSSTPGQLHFYQCFRWRTYSEIRCQFPIPPGILINGTNTIAVSHWALESDKDALSIGAEGIKVVVSGLTETGFDMGPVWNQYV